MTASVHYIRFAVTPPQAAKLAAGPVVLAVTHPRYRYETVLDGRDQGGIASTSPPPV